MTERRRTAYNAKDKAVRSSLAVHTWGLRSIAVRAAETPSGPVETILGAFLPVIT